MKLTQKELKVIRLERLSAYKKRVQKHLEYGTHYDVISFTSELQELASNIVEVENELDENFPKWNDIPF